MLLLFFTTVLLLAIGSVMYLLAMLINPNVLTFGDGML